MYAALRPQEERLFLGFEPMTSGSQDSNLIAKAHPPQCKHAIIGIKCMQVYSLPSAIIERKQPSEP